MKAAFPNETLELFKLMSSFSQQHALANSIASMKFVVMFCVLCCFPFYQSVLQEWIRVAEPRPLVCFPTWFHLLSACRVSAKYAIILSALDDLDDLA